MGLPETRYARSGELHIAYQALGDGPCDERMDDPRALLTQDAGE